MRGRGGGETRDCCALQSSSYQIPEEKEKPEDSHPGPLPTSNSNGPARLLRGSRKEIDVPIIYFEPLAF